ncbi:MAG: glutamate--tRNA ligase [Phycisphaerales bacterium]|nr:glutamate--tRNA ligase [Phycisphaerales bacterium]
MNINCSKLHRPVRVRFAPSPTGGLHIGGFRTLLFNYLFAKKNNGTLILRIEDTDSLRFVAGAEAYIEEVSQWSGVIFDESPQKEGAYAPYRQSERKEKGIYQAYIKKLLDSGVAYYAFDTSEELADQRKIMPNFQYGIHTRDALKNSLSMLPTEVETRIARGDKFVIRFKMPADETILLHDALRGPISFQTNQLDDKVLIKNDGMPTYHFAVVVDDYEMDISHVFRGEEWLPSAPLHVLLWKELFGSDYMPQWIHLPLILKTDGKGKLSKRDAQKQGFPIYPIDWIDPNTQEFTKGFKETGFLPEAFINFLALLGWTPPHQKEILPLNTMIDNFSIAHIHKTSAKFDFEKAKWFNHEWMKKKCVDDAQLFTEVVYLYCTNRAKKQADTYNQDHFEMFFKPSIIISLVGNCYVLDDFLKYYQLFYPVNSPISYSNVEFTKLLQQLSTISYKVLTEIYDSLSGQQNFDDSQFLEDAINKLLLSHQIKHKDIFPFLRFSLIGQLHGLNIFWIVKILGKEESCNRIKNALGSIKKIV